MKYFITYKYNLRGIAPNGHVARSLSKDLNNHIRRELGLDRATPLNEQNGYRSEMTLSTTSDPKLDPEFTKVYPYYQKNIYVDFKVTPFGEDKKDLLRSASPFLKELNMKNAFFSKRKDSLKDLNRKLKSSKPRDLLLLVLELERLERQNTSQKMIYADLTSKARTRFSKSLRELRQRVRKAKRTREVEEVAVEVASLNALPEVVEGQKGVLYDLKMTLIKNYQIAGGTKKKIVTILSREKRANQIRHASLLLSELQEEIELLKL